MNKVIMAVSAIFIAASVTMGQEKINGDKKPGMGLNALLVGVNKDRVNSFKSILEANKIKVTTAEFEGLNKELAKKFDVVILDPETGSTNSHGQSKSRGIKVTEDLGKPVLAIGAPGSTALIPLKLKFGNNG